MSVSIYLSRNKFTEKKKGRFCFFRVCPAFLSWICTCACGVVAAGEGSELTANVHSHTAFLSRALYALLGFG